MARRWCWESQRVALVQIWALDRVLLSFEHAPHPNISLWDVTFHANTERFRGSVPLLPHLCPLSVPEVGVCGVYSESP